MYSFETLIQELSEELDTPLNVDRNGCCSILLDDTLTIELEPESDDRLLLGAFIGDLPAGSLRKEVLRSALKANHLPQKSLLGFYEEENQLMLFQYIPTEGLTITELVDILAEFSDRAFRWYTALLAGETAPSEEKTEEKTAPFFR